MARRAPNQLAGTIGHYQGIAAAHRHHKPRVFGPFGQPDDAPAVGVPPVPPAFLRLEDPANRAIGIQRGVAGEDFIPAVSIKIDGQGLMSGSIAAGLLDRPEETSIADTLSMPLASI